MALDPLQDPPIIWRTKLRSLKEGVNLAAQVAHNIEGGRVGIGWGIEELRTRSSLAKVLEAIRSRDEKGWGRQAASTVRLFGEEAKVGDYLWTRDLNGRFHLGRIAGPYRYENSALAKKLDTHQVRDAEWAPRPLNDLEVPGAIIRGFSGTSTSFSRIWDEGARIYTAWLWEDLHGRKPAPLQLTAREVLKMLDPYDLEDLVYVWMQVAEDYLALPKARRTDTPAYEWTLLHRTRHTPAIVQVKSGEQAVDQEALAQAATTRAMALFAYSAAETYEGSPRRKVRQIGTDELLALVDEQPAVLPKRVGTWFARSRPS